MINDARKHMRRELDQRHTQPEQHEARFLRARGPLGLAADLAELAGDRRQLAVDVAEALARLDAKRGRFGPIVDGLARDLVGGAVGLPRELLGRCTEGHARRAPRANGAT